MYNRLYPNLIFVSLKKYNFFKKFSGTKLNIQNDVF
jgi:hypothetical protein